MRVYVGVVVCVLFSSVATSKAESKRVVLVDPGTALLDAVTGALEPWGIVVSTVSSPNPGATMPATATSAQGVAGRQGAAALVWISKAASGYALWVFDRATSKLMTRRLARPPPYDEPTAAAVALTIKTLLRHSFAAPERQRFGSTKSERPVTSPPRTVKVTTPRWTFGFEGWFGVRARGAEPRVGGLLSFRPSLWNRRWSLALGLRSGPGISLDDAGFVGHHSDTVALVLSELRVDFSERVAIYPALGGALHFTQLDGAIIASGMRAKVGRVNPAVLASIKLDVRVARLRFGVRGQVSYVSRRQEYTIGTQTVLDLPAMELHAAAVITLPIY